MSSVQVDLPLGFQPSPVCTAQVPFEAMSTLPRLTLASRLCATNAGKKKNICIGTYEHITCSNVTLTFASRLCGTDASNAEDQVSEACAAAHVIAEQAKAEPGALDGRMMQQVCVCSGGGGRRQACQCSSFS